ncbi:SPOR domain-containing protein [Streptomyces hoynatensis]|uniref:SPOR domain-containing protein n=1 Tax=Streptomyces hoynatensis TaxID=1141874 RepID=UPI001F4EEB4F|nr:SPOR domain-containing protein [Streptomyces hoynatensis]
MKGTNLRPWQVIRQEEDGGRYRIGQCATRAEAQRLIQRLQLSTDGRVGASRAAHYVVERVEPVTPAQR